MSRAGKEVVASLQAGELSGHRITRVAKGRNKPKVPTPKQIKAFRTTRGLTQKQAAEMFGITQGQWSSWESGRNKAPALLSLAFEKFQEEE